MNVNGFLIREAIRRHELRRDAAAGQFDDSLYKFHDETKVHPDDVTKAYVAAETAISKLEAAQTRYNMKVQVTLPGNETMSLCEAVKRLGGASRIEKMWKNAASPKKNKYAYMSDSPTERDPSKLRAAYVLPKQDMLNRANKFATITGSLRAAVAKGNGTEYPAAELGLDVALLTE